MPGQAKYVEWSVDRDERGYTIVVEGVDGNRLELYQNGNHPSISEVWLRRDDPKALKPSQLKQEAYDCACEFAKQYGVGLDAVYESDDPYP